MSASCAPEKFTVGDTESIRVRRVKDCLSRLQTARDSAAALRASVCRDVTSTVCYDVSEIVCYGVSEEICTEVTTIVTQQIDPSSQWIAWPNRSSWGIAVDPSNNSYVLSRPADSDPANTSFVVVTYDPTGLKIAVAYRPLPAYADPPVVLSVWPVWDICSSCLFIAESISSFDVATDGTDVRLIKYDPVTITFQETPAITLTGYYFAASIALSDRNGNIHVIANSTYDSAPSNATIYTYDTNLTPGISGEIANTSSYVRILHESCVDASQNLYIAFQDVSGTDPDITEFHTLCKLDMGLTLTWKLEIPFLSANTLYNYSSVVTDEAQLYYFYADGRDVYFTKVSPTDGSALPPTVIYSSIYGDDGHIIDLSVTRNANGRVFYMLMDATLAADNPQSPWLRRVAEIDVSSGVTVWSETYDDQGYQIGQPLTGSTEEFLWVIYNRNETEYPVEQYLLQEEVTVTETICDISYSQICDISESTVCSTEVKQVCECPCPNPTPSRQITTVADSDYILSRLAECPITVTNADTGGSCLGATTTGQPTTRAVVVKPVVTSAPSALHHVRTHHRIRRIEDVAQPARTNTSSARTARLRSELATRRPERHAEHFRPQIPLPPCPVRLPRQPGVPTARTLPCNPGFQSVDFSSPIA
jgi:hypothetical protein